MSEHRPCAAAAAAAASDPPLPWWLRGLLATASALTGALIPLADEPREAWDCPFCSWETVPS